jgi:hypothetical protein
MPRPRLHPTDEQRKLVKSLAAVGLKQDDVAPFVGIRSPKTLRKYFRVELQQGQLEAYAKALRIFFQMATDGKHGSMTMAWVNRHDRRQKHSSQDPPASPPVFLIVPEEDQAA